jgi:hypothetical protein
MSDALAQILANAVHEIDRLDRINAALLGAIQPCRDALSWIQKRIENGDVIVMERGWNEEIGDADRAIALAKNPAEAVEQ